jgi:hypothetical protein
MKAGAARLARSFAEPQVSMLFVVNLALGLTGLLLIGSFSASL